MLSNDYPMVLTFAGNDFYATSENTADISDDEVNTVFRVFEFYIPHSKTELSGQLSVIGSSD